MAEPVDLADIKRHLALDDGYTAEDANLTSMIVAARRSCELRTRRSIIGEDRTLVLDGFPGSEPISLIWAATASPAAEIRGDEDIALRGGSISTVEIRYYDTDGADITLDAAEYHAALAQVPALLRTKTSWPLTQDRPDAVRVTYTVSPLEAGDLEMIRHAIRLIVGHWHMNREAVSTEAGSGAMELPLAATWLLDPLTQFATD